MPSTAHIDQLLDERIRTTVADMAADNDVRYAGSLLMPTDEVVLFMFEGSEDRVRQAAQRAAVPFDRIVPTSSRSVFLAADGGREK